MSLKQLNDEAYSAVLTTDVRTLRLMSILCDISCCESSINVFLTLKAFVVRFQRSR